MFHRDSYNSIKDDPRILETQELYNAAGKADKFKYHIYTALTEYAHKDVEDLAGSVNEYLRERLES